MPRSLVQIQPVASPITLGELLAFASLFAQLKDEKMKMTTVSRGAVRD